MSSNAAPAPENNPTPPPELQVVPPPQPAAPEPEAKKHPSQLNLKQQAQVTKAEILIPVCRKPAYAPELAARHINEAFLVALEGKIAQARTNAKTAVVCTNAGKGCTLEEQAAERALMESLRDFQGAARLKYRRTDPTHLKDYFIGSEINQSRPLLEESAEIIIDNTNTDRPAPVETSMITAAEAQLQAYKDAKQPQRDEKSSASGARQSRNARVAEIVFDRQQIQLAADNAWPYTDPANRKARMEFGLPQNQPYTA